MLLIKSEIHQPPFARKNVIRAASEKKQGGNIADFRDAVEPTRIKSVETMFTVFKLLRADAELFRQAALRHG